MSLLKALNLTPAKRPPSTASMPGPAARSAVASTQRSAAPANGSAHKVAPAQKLTVNNYIALINGIDHQTTGWKKPGPIDVSPSDPHDLTAPHRDMLNMLHSGLGVLKSTPSVAVKLWESVAPSLRSEVGKAVPAGLTSSDIAGCLQQLTYLEDTVFGPVAYAEAKRAAETDSGLEAPDLAQMEGRLASAEKDLKDANELFEQTLKLAASTGKLAGLGKPGEVKEIVEMVMMPGSIKEKLEFARKHGIAATAAELVSKVGSATGTFIKSAGEVGEKVVEARKAFVLSRGASKAAKETAEKLEKVAVKFKKLAAVGKAIGKGASYAAVIVDGIKLVSALRDGDYDEAVSVALDLIEDAAPLVLGEDLAGPVAVVVVLVKAELEVWKLAASFIRYCKDETVRQAAESFVKDCNVIAKTAHELVADCTLLQNATNASVQAIAMKKANREAAIVSKGIKALSSHVTTKDKNAIGGYPAVVASFGKPAIAAMAIAFDENDGVVLVAQQVQDLFHGANAMASYVREHYTN